MPLWIKPHGLSIRGIVLRYTAHSCCFALFVGFCRIGAPPHWHSFLAVMQFPCCLCSLLVCQLVLFFLHLCSCNHEHPSPFVEIPPFMEILAFAIAFNLFCPIVSVAFCYATFSVHENVGIRHVISCWLSGSCIIVILVMQWAVLTWHRKHRTCSSDDVITFQRDYCNDAWSWGSHDIEHIERVAPMMLSHFNVIIAMMH